jgi:RNA polymerase sigma factor (sigma-70 family)
MYPEHRGNEGSRPALQQYLADIERVTPLSAQEIRQLIAHLPERTARDRLIEGHLPLVLQIARTYQGCGITLADLIQIGSLSLVEEIATWTPSAPPSVARSLPGTLHLALQRAITAEARKQGKEGQGLPHSRVGRAAEQLDRRTCRRRRRGWRNAPRRQQTPEALRAWRQPVETQFVRDACAGVIAVLLRLSRREREILSARFGSAGPVGISYQLIARQLGVSPRTVRRHARSGLGKLRQARMLLRFLRSFLQS